MDTDQEHNLRPHEPNLRSQEPNLRPSPAFVGASWTALLVGMAGYLIGLWNSGMDLTEKRFYLTILLFGLFSAVSVQKSVRDRGEGVPVSSLYYGISWSATAMSVTLLTVSLWNAPMSLSEKGFYAMAYMMAMFAAVAVQKNVRDLAAAGGPAGPDAARSRGLHPGAALTTRSITSPFHPVRVQTRVGSTSARGPAGR